MAEIYSVVAAFGSNADAEGAVQKLERSGLHNSLMSIENRVSPIHQRTAQSSGELGMGSSAITGALLGGFWGYLVHADRLQRGKEGAFNLGPHLSCLGSAVKGACLFAGVSFIRLSMQGDVSRLHLLQDGPTLSVDPYLLVVHGTPAAVTLAGEILRAA